MIVLFLCFFCFVQCVKCEKYDVSKACVDNNTYRLPRKIWSFWERIIPEDVEEMMNITKSSLSNFSFLFLMGNNVSEVLDLNFFPNNYETLWPQGKADYVRVHLLERYGGIWLDCTVIVNSGKEMEWVFTEAVESRCHFFSFSLCHHKYFLSMPFIGAPENSIFMKNYCREVETIISGDVCSSLKKICPLLRKKGYKGTCGKYHFVDVVYAKIILVNPAMSEGVLLLSTSRGPYSLQAECGLVTECVKYRILHDRRTRDIPFIKLGSEVRDGKRLYFKEGRYLNSWSYNEWLKRYKFKVKKKKRKII